MTNSDFVEHRLRELAAFERRAAGEDGPRRPPTAHHTANLETKAMSLFQPAESTSAYLKMGMLGFAGSGKTKTASLTAIGLIQHMKSLNIDYANRPAYFLDTEKGSDWVKKDFDAVGIPLYAAKTRAFSDLLAAVPEAQANGSVLIIDSISHFWKELCETYQKSKAAQFKRSTYRLQFQDWGWLKGEWGRFTDMFVNSPLHIILAGRAGYEYDYFEEDGKKELEKTGVKMKAEGEMGYEPDLLVHMERRQMIEGSSVSKTWHEATILKDRSTLLDGSTFTFDGHLNSGERMPFDALVRQTWTAFAPHIKCLNFGGKQLGIDTSRTSDGIIKIEKRDWQPVQREIVLEEIQHLLIKHYPSQAVADKQARTALMQKHFSALWTEIEKTFDLLTLRAGYDSLHCELEKRPSRYASAMEAEAAPLELNDDIPDHSKAPAPTLVASAAA